MKTKTFTITIAMFMLLSAGCTQNTKNSTNITTNPTKTNKMTSNKTQNNTETYTNTKYKFSVEYPKENGPYEFKENPDSLLDLYFTGKQQDGTVTVPDYGVINYFSISVYNSSVDTQVKKYTNELGFSKTNTKINNNNFTIVEYKVASLPGSNEYEQKKIAILQNNNTTFVIHPFYSENLETIITSFKLLQ